MAFKNFFRETFPSIYLSLFIFKQNLWIFHYLLFVKVLNINFGFFKDDFFKNKKIIIIGPADSSLNYLPSEIIDKFDIIVRINDSPNTLTKNQSIGTRTDILYHNLYLKENPDINEQLLLSQKNQLVLYNWNLSHLESNFNLARLKYKNIIIIKVHPIYYAKLIKEYIKYKLSPTTGVLALNHLMYQKFKELHVVGFTFYKTKYIEGYKGIKPTTLKSEYEAVIGVGYHNPQKDLETFLKLYLRFSKKKLIILDSTLTAIIDNEIKSRLNPN